MNQFVIVAYDDQNVLKKARSVIEHKGILAVLAADGKQANMS